MVAKSSLPMNVLCTNISKHQIKKHISCPRSGDFIRVGFEISEGQKTRIQFFQGLVLAVRGVGITKNILVRRAFKGFCVERIILLNSPQIKQFQIINHTNVRRSKLYYVRSLYGKKARILTGKV
jgi:large subunit ribosomal protein L19